MLTISARFSKSSTYSRFSQKLWLRPRRSRGFAKASYSNSRVYLGISRAWLLPASIVG
jgi:hypothetical protein